MRAGCESRYRLIRGMFYNGGVPLMRLGHFLLCAMIGLWLGAPAAALAQDRATVPGLFGQRSLGTTLAPRPRSFGSGGIVTDPGGSFLGRGRLGGMQFNAMPWQYPNVGLRPGPLTPPPRPWEAALERLAETSAGSPSQAPARLFKPPGEPSPEGAAQAPRPEANGAATASGQVLPSPVVGAIANAAPPAPGGAPLSPNTAVAAPPPLVSTLFGGVPPSADPAARLAERIRRTDRINKRSPITVELQGQIAILRGRVATEHDRQLTEALARLEPGIGRVQNELTVAGSR